MEIKAPNPTPIWCTNLTFLAGSIEMGKAENWQERIVREFENTSYTFLNPRRDDWDASWVQSIDNSQFAEQVNWELDNITRASLVVFYFDPSTKSPITLMELGVIAARDRRGSLLRDSQSVIVCCPKGFWRKGNVDILCQRYKIPVYETLEDIIKYLKGDD